MLNSILKDAGKKESNESQVTNKLKITILSRSIQFSSGIIMFPSSIIAKKPVTEVRIEYK